VGGARKACLARSTNIAQVGVGLGMGRDGGADAVQHLLAAAGSHRLLLLPSQLHDRPTCLLKALTVCIPCCKAPMGAAHPASSPSRF
jgi:hypothetical protein